MSQPNPPTSELPLWHSQLILVCEKCGKKLDKDRPVALNVKDALKKALISEGKWGPTRVVVSSCLDLCPEGQLAIAITGDSGAASEVIAIDPAQAKDFVLMRMTQRPPA